MARILIIDDTAIVRDPLSASLRLAGYQTETANNGKEGLAKVKAAPPDLVMLDVAMPEMDGLAVIAAMRGDPALKNIPVILLTALADRQTVVRAAQLGVRDYLLKSRFSLAELLERVQRLLTKTPASPPSPPSPSQPKPAAPAPSSEISDLPRLLTREQCLARVENAISARPMSGVVGQVLSMAGSPLAEMSELASLIGRDPLLSARVLRAANSAAFAGARKIVSTIQDAVRNIGMGAVRNISTALSVYEAIPNSGADGFHHMRDWQHSFATATLCQHLAESAAPQEAGAAYLVGLCHNLGQILFRSEFGKEYTQVLTARAATGRSIEELERHMLGTTQLDLARVILEKMSLPVTIRQPIEEFHTLKSQAARHKNTEPTAPAFALTGILQLSDLYATGIGMASMLTSETGPITKADCRAALGKDDPPIPNAPEVRGQILALTPLLARLPEADEKKLCQPMMPPTGKRIWLMRDGEFSSFDPLAAALEALGDVKISRQLPTDAELQALDVLVVAARQRYPLRAAGTIPTLRMALEDAPPQAVNIIECGLRISLEKLSAFLSATPVPLKAAA